MRCAVFRLLCPKNQNCRSGIIQSVLFYPQNKLYPTIISAAAVITRKKVVGNIKAQVMPKPTQNSMRPHNRFISILPKRNVYDSLFGLLDNDSQSLCIFPVITNFTSEFSLPDSVSYRKKFHSREPDHSCLQTLLHTCVHRSGAMPFHSFLPFSQVRQNT